MGIHPKAQLPETSLDLAGPRRACVLLKAGREPGPHPCPLTRAGRALAGLGLAAAALAAPPAHLWHW